MILQNAVKFDGQYYKSTARHDLVSFGKGLYIDGGTDYVRCNFAFHEENGIESMLLVVENSDEEIYERFLCWDSNNKEWVLFKDLSSQNQKAYLAGLSCGTVREERIYDALINALITRNS